MGDHELASALHRYSSNAFGAGWQGAHYLYKEAPRTLHATVLYALAAAIEPGGEDFQKLFNAPPNRALLAQPSLLKVGAGHAPPLQGCDVGVSEARFEPSSSTLHIAVRQPGDP